MGYNLLFEAVHTRAGCGRNQFQRNLKECIEEGSVLSQQSSLHKRGVKLEINTEAYPKLQKQGFGTAVEAIVNYLFPFAEFRDTGSIEEQLAFWDVAKLLPFTIKIELTSDVLPGGKLTAYGDVNKKLEILNLKVAFEKS
jgi:hypothetical protein